MTPSDVLAGIILLAAKEPDQFYREYKLFRAANTASVTDQLTPSCSGATTATTTTTTTTITTTTSSDAQVRPKWMTVNDACYYVRYATACYSWSYYLYMHNLRGFSDICCTPRQTVDGQASGSTLFGSCCCCCCYPTMPPTTAAMAAEKKSSAMDADNRDETIIVDDNDNGELDEQHTNASADLNVIVEGDGNLERHIKAFKYLSHIDDCNLIYASFHNELFFSPFCVLLDHHKRSVVITIRGTLSMR